MPVSVQKQKYGMDVMIQQAGKQGSFTVCGIVCGRILQRCGTGMRMKRFPLRTLRNYEMIMVIFLAVASIATPVQRQRFFQTQSGYLRPTISKIICLQEEFEHNCDAELESILKEYEYGNIVIKGLLNN